MFSWCWYCCFAKVIYWGVLTTFRVQLNLLYKPVRRPWTPVLVKFFHYFKPKSNFKFIDFFKFRTTNKKEQMPPQCLIILTRGIQIRGQPINHNFFFDFFFLIIFSIFLVRTPQCNKNLKKINFCPWKHEKTGLKSCS